jgi:membrane protein YdbS with pleckstrin-like domain
VSFEAEILLARLRARSSKLLGPTLLLGLAAFLLSFLSPKTTEAWQAIVVDAICGLIALFGFVFPTVRYLTAWTDITSSRVVTRSGLFGQHFREVSLSDVQRVELTGGLINLHVLGQEPLEIKSLPKAKLVAQEISQLTAKSSLGAK